jgi:hypothetical protein
VAKISEKLVDKNEKGEGISLDELKNNEGGIEPIDTKQLIDGAGELALFMEEKLTIHVFEDGNEGALKVIGPSVNGVTQPIIRGVNTKVKRKYVEALARGITTKYEQRQVDPGNPASLKMFPIRRQTYPFSVIHDPNPKGAAWLAKIINERD